MKESSNQSNEMVHDIVPLHMMKVSTTGDYELLYLTAVYPFSVEIEFIICQFDATKRMSCYGRIKGNVHGT
jgi:hypothetical protein